MEDQLIYLGLAAVFGLFMAWGIGANDVANAMATSIGSGALTIRKAVIIAAIFEFAGAVLAGGSVTSTIRSGTIDSPFVVDASRLARFDYAFNSGCHRRFRDRRVRHELC